jgi:hypothetical protein
MTLFQTESEEIYEIRVKGALSPAWSGWFSNFDLSVDAQGNTLMIGPVTDQAALHGVLERIRDLGLSLLSVRQITSPKTHPSNINEKE